MAGAVIQSTILPHFSIWGLRIELVLLLVVSWSMLQGPEAGILWAIVGGLGLDLFSAVPFGTMTTALALTSFVIGKVGIGLLRTNSLLPIAMAPVATALFNGTVALILEGFGWHLPWSELLTGVILPLALLDTVAMVPVFGLLYGLHSRTQPEINW
ncbi:MAG: rod shape-determining protein MreD [Chloroflexi bacterium]|nr:rod shape-determining protein MreD [Chloroflexota bacterium]